MAWSFDFSSGYATITMTGSIAYGDVERAFFDFLGHPEFRIGRDSVWDLREASGDFSADDFRRLVGVVKGRRERRGDKVAIVVSRDLHFGLGRMYQLIADYPEQRHMVFRSLEEARQWLTS